MAASVPTAVRQVPAIDPVKRTSTGRWIHAFAEDILQFGIQGSALLTLGCSLGDVVSWIFVSWLCLNWFLTINSHLGGIMVKILKTTLKTGLDTLAALRGHGND